VSVLPPVDTRSWRAGHMEEHIREVRDMFLHALD